MVTKDLAWKDTLKAEWVELKDLLGLTSMDLHFAVLMQNLACGDVSLFLAAALASSQTRFGHVCLDLNSVAGAPLGEGTGKTFPEREEWIQALRNSPVVGRPGEYKPLVLDDSSRLFLYRYWDYQDRLGRFILDRVGRRTTLTPDRTDELRNRLDRLFPVEDGEKIHDQKRAACVSLLHDFSVISGGPGTGKTTTVARLLVLLIETHHMSGTPSPLRIRLAAPTGKAAARLKESMAEAFGRMDLSDAVKKELPEEVTTIHRLLGSVRHSPYFRYNESRKLPADIVIVDEASMVDLALMSKLGAALKETARLILLGDQDQLASVEAGAVLGDICNTGYRVSCERELDELISDLTGIPAPSPRNTGGHPSPMANGISVLRWSFRFDDSSGIGALSRAVNQGDPAAVADVLESGTADDVVFCGVPDPESLSEDIEELVVRGYEAYLGRDFSGETFALFDRFRILCAVRKGPCGVETLNRAVEQILARHGWIDPSKEWYVGRPVMITRNDYSLGLFNGDVGVVIRDTLSGSLVVAFPDGRTGVRTVRPDKLPGHETVFAMTVHKSQGSEFDSVLLILPREEKPVLTRELVYTGITRARKSLALMAGQAELAYAVKRRTQRQSGLRDLLWKNTKKRD